MDSDYGQRWRLMATEIEMDKWTSMDNNGD